ncbi:MAG: arginine--tRNA ligase, partial [Candidatus Altiarchaeota archaeon]|nr:arginine--tRNA ligase [Candidatus Altiarchaeota archaeon]
MKALKEEIARVLSGASGTEVGVCDVVSSPVADLGSPIAFKLGKVGRADPRVIASDIVSKIKCRGLISSVVSDGGYVNFFLDYKKLTELVFEDCFFPRKNVRVVLEHTSVNPTGPLHVGRIRNSLIGDSLKRIMSFVGYDVETHYYVNDVGRQVVLISQGLEKKLAANEKLVERYSTYSKRGDYMVFFVYVEANRLSESDDAFMDDVTGLIRRAESGDDKVLDLIKSTAKTALEGQMETFNRLGIVFDVFDFESECLRDNSVEEVMTKVRDSGFYVKSDVGEGVDLSSFGVEKGAGFTVLARADGTSVYLSRDLAYHLKKLGWGERVINVLGEDHKLQFKELSTILREVLGVDRDVEVVHFSFVNFEGTKFSTRKGEVATVDELLDESCENALAEVRSRELGDEDTARMVGVGAVKFHIVKTTPNKPITFSFSDALNFDGETAPYIQYAHARSCRILEKAGDFKADVDFQVSDKDEKELIFRLLEFEDVICEAARQLRPDLVATYLISLTSSYG